MKKIVAIATTAMALVSSNAMAEGRWPNWYVGLHGSLDFVGETELDDNPVVNNFDSDQGFGYGASIGYRPAIGNAVARNFRMEVEWNRQTADLDKVDSSFGSFSGNGKTIASAVMANFFYDFVMTDQYRQTKPFYPYIGGGLGWSTIKLDGADSSLGNINDSDNVFAYQFLAGLAYLPQFMPFTEWSLGYRYFDTMDPEFSYVGGGKFSADYNSHNLELGVHFLF